MTKNNRLSLTKKILIFVLSALMCFSLFFATACKEEEKNSSTIPEYFYTDKSDCDIDNPDFTYGTSNLSYSDYPKTSISGWNIAKNATSNSGVIDVSDKGWKKLLSNLAKDNGILNYVRENNGDFTDADIRAEMIENFPDKYNNDNKKPTTSQIREYIIEKYFIIPETPAQGINYPFTNPSKHTNATDNKIYMLNNYKTSDFGYGCAQSLNSAKTITLNAGEYAKISVFVKTENLNTQNTVIGYGKEIGANIRIANIFNGEDQSDFGIFNITDTEWTEYKFYVKADSVFQTKFALSLGLGYGDYAAEGTAYFDDITVKLLNKTEYEQEINNQQTNVIAYNLEYKEQDNLNMQIDASTYDNQKYYLYDMSLDLANIQGFTSILSYSNDQDYYSFTKYKVENGTLNGNITGLPKQDVFTADVNTNEIVDVPYGIDEGLKVELKKPASVTVKLDNNGQNFKLDEETYTAITFFVKNKLDKRYAKDIVVNVQDILTGAKTIEHSAVVTISELSDEWKKYTVFVRNNFASVKREFYLDIVIGPDTHQDGIDKYSKGSVYLSNPIVATGSINQYVDDSNKVETPNYTYFNLLSSTASGDIALHAGYNQDSNDNTTNNTVYNFSVASNEIGIIETKPAIPQGFTGIKSNHYYITNDNNDSLIINENKNSGLINTKYINNYKTEIKNALNYNGEDDIQPLMIAPLNDGTNNYSYGFISENYTIPSNSYGKISVDLKVNDSVAYIYLVDVSKKQKDILKFDEFTVNTSTGKFDNLNQTISEKSLFFTVDESMMNGQDWLTVEFFIATGYNKKDFRIELWNGDRSSTSPLTTNGFVFVNDVNVETDTAFDEPSRWQDAFSDDKVNNPLLGKVSEFVNTDNTPVSGTELLTHQRELTDIEKKYNKDENKQNANIVYQPKYVWAKTDTMIYAIYNTIDPTYFNPYDFEPVEDEKEETSLIKTDPATFWLSFSSILLGVALVVAILMLFIKNIRRRRKASKSDAKSHYTVKSRVRKPQEPVQKPKYEEEVEDFEPIMEPEVNEQTEKEQSLDDYVYGEVQDFGESSDTDKSDE